MQKYIDQGYYPFSQTIKNQLEKRQRDLGIPSEVLEEFMKPIFAEAEASYHKSINAEKPDLPGQIVLDGDTLSPDESPSPKAGPELSLVNDDVKPFEIFDRPDASREAEQKESTQPVESKGPSDSEMNQHAASILATEEAGLLDKQDRQQPLTGSQQDHTQENLFLEADAESQQSSDQKQESEADKKADIVISTMITTVVGVAVIPTYVNWSITAAAIGTGVIGIGRCYGKEITTEEAWNLVKGFMAAAGLWYLGWILSGRILSIIMTSTGVGYAGSVALDATLSAALAYAIGESAKMYFKGEENKGKLGKIFRDKFRSARQDWEKKRKT